MHAKDAIRGTLDMGEHILNSYVGDLDDADLTTPPAEGLNPIAWQLGHLISSERSMVEQVRPNSCPALPEGFDATHSREAAVPGASHHFLPKAEYLRLFQAQRTATKAAIEALSDADLDAPSPERYQKMAPTVGAVLGLVGNHVLMHVGQFVPARRKGNKPVVI